MNAYLKLDHVDKTFDARRQPQPRCCATSR